MVMGRACGKGESGSGDMGQKDKNQGHCHTKRRSTREFEGYEGRARIERLSGKEW
jgi:hypothetical protein